MALYAGFDEAGYGSLLGPMTVGFSAWIVPDAEVAGGTEGAQGTAAAPNLWRALSGAVCKKPGDRRGRLAIADSKQLKGRGGADLHDAAMLERGVLAALECSERIDLTGALTDRCVLQALEAGPLPEHAPWTGDALDAPIGCDRTDAHLAARSLSKALQAHGGRLVAIGAHAIEVDDLNREFARGVAKPSIPFSVALERARSLTQDSGERSGWLAFDRQSGRVRYRNDLQHAWPDGRIAILSETERESLYRLVTEHGSFAVSFTVGAESAHLPIALASMAAKYLRELRMERFNRFFKRLAPDLAPTAGYVEDGRRFLEQAAPVMAAAGIESARLVRSK
ncbi:MAG: hypothetical protein O2819_08350 [Planctomycetota bacterium]|nr:hypothetical protein [Planctomycetota bacterium]MDA1106644.1 hypothetical protein [Planctomycetota bacterium]